VEKSAGNALSGVHGWSSGWSHLVENDMTLKVVDLFSGIGGFALGLQMAGPFETVCFVEIDPFCQKVLKKNFPGVPIYDDIKKIQWVVADTSEFQFQSNGGLDTGKRMGSTEEGSYPNQKPYR